MEIIKKFDMNTPTWDEVIENLNLSIFYNKLIKSNNTGFFVSHDAYMIPKVKELMNVFKLTSAHLYINFIFNGETFGKHVDTMDVKFWQIIGKTKWIIDNKEYILERGDLISVPKGIYHEVISMEPRAGISFG